MYIEERRDGIRGDIGVIGSMDTGRGESWNEEKVMEKDAGRVQRGRRNRRMGAEVERQIVWLLRDGGIAAEKVSRTGYVGPDIRVGDEWLGECKLRASGWGRIRGWLKGVDFLFLREPREREPLVVMEFKVFMAMMKCREVDHELHHELRE